jgi:hypothetical protein
MDKRIKTMNMANSYGSMTGMAGSSREFYMKKDKLVFLTTL